MVEFTENEWRKLPRRLARRVRRLLKAGGYRVMNADGTPASELAVRIYLAGALRAALADIAGLDDDDE